MLAGQIGGSEVHQVGQISGLGPIGKGALAARGASAPDHGGYQGLAHGKCITDLHVPIRGNGSVDSTGKIQFLSEMVKRSHSAGRNRRDSYWHFLLLLLMAQQDIVDAAEMGEHANGGLAIVAA